jgi:hypothetical protein
VQLGGGEGAGRFGERAEHGATRRGDAIALLP